MNVTVEIKYQADGGRVVQGGTFPLKKRKPEEVAYEWLQQIKRQVTYKELISVIVNGDQDITGKILEIEKAPLD